MRNIDVWAYSALKPIYYKYRILTSFVFNSFMQYNNCAYYNVYINVNPFFVNLEKHGVIFTKHELHFV